MRLFKTAEGLRQFLGLQTVQGIYVMPKDKPLPAKHELRVRDHLEKQAKEASK